MDRTKTAGEQDPSAISETPQQTDHGVEAQVRRDSPRYPFFVVQPVAPYFNSELPNKQDFVQVRCHDISASGISFYWPVQPDFRYAVIGLGPPPHRYMTVRIVQCEQHNTSEGAEYRIGCQFLGHVQPSG